MKILIAEDDFISQKLLRAILREQGYETIAFPNGKEALAYFQDNPVSIILSDWMMPEMNGLEFCQAIRQLDVPDYTHFIMITAKTGAENYRMAMQAGVDDFLPKPVRKEDLFIKLRVTERVIRQRQEAEAKIRALARFPEDNPNPVLRIDDHAKIQYANHACELLLAAWNRKLGDPLPEALWPLVRHRSGSPERLRETEISCGDQIYSFAITSIYDGDGTYLYGHNITDRKRAEKELVSLKNKAVQASLHDHLTGLPNRALLREHLALDMARCQRNGTRMAMLMVDIDHFKTINDSLGHQTGDEVLLLVSQCLKDHLRTTDTVCRWGGDELMVLLPDLEDRCFVPSICHKLVHALQKRVMRSSLSLPVTLSMGSAVYPEDASEPEALMQQADYALYRAKADGRNCHREFRGFDTQHEAKSKPSMYLRLNRAIEQGRIETHFQPIVEARTGLVASLEGLARWHDAEDGWVSPEVFITLAEEKGLIRALGRQIIANTLRQLSGLHEQGFLITTSFNLSRAQLIDPDFQPELESAARQAGIAPQWIILEITERESLLSNPLIRQNLISLGNAGFRLSLDDFGTGFASIDVVAEMPFQELKIPRVIAKRSDTDKGFRMIKAIVDMAKALNLKVVVEGVETEEMAANLRQAGADKLQGFLFAKPMSSDLLGAFVARTGVIPPSIADQAQAA